MRRPTADWVVFTDLDGTLLDHTSYKWDAAREALEDLRDARVPLVIVTSKTRAEAMPFLRRLRRREPFVVENGGAIYFPAGYFPPNITGALPAGRGWLRVALGTSRPRLLRALARAAKRAGVRVRGFAQMREREVRDLAGLPLPRARRARQREFDEPFVILEGGERATSKLKHAIHREGLQLTRGSRFLHILGDNDKGAAVQKLISWFRRARGGAVRTVGLGDSPNDIPMLRAVHVPIVVARPGGRYDQATLSAVAGVRRAGGVGPAGWNRAVLHLLRPSRYSI